MKARKRESNPAGTPINKAAGRASKKPEATRIKLEATAGGNRGSTASSINRRATGPGPGRSSSLFTDRAANSQSNATAAIPSAVQRIEFASRFIGIEFSRPPVETIVRQLASDRCRRVGEEY